MRWSMIAVMLSRIGTSQNSPGPFTPCSLPARRMTKRSHAFAILSDAKMTTASTKNAAAGIDIRAASNPSPITTATTVRNIVMGFMDPLRWRRAGARRLPQQLYGNGAQLGSTRLFPGGQRSRGCEAGGYFRFSAPRDFRREVARIAALTYEAEGASPPASEAQLQGNVVGQRKVRSGKPQGSGVAAPARAAPAGAGD